MTLSEFYAARQNGSYEDDTIALWLDDTMVPPLPSHIVIEKRDLAQLDFRFFVWMKVFVYTDAYTPELLKVLDTLKQTADFILVGLTEFGDDLGWKWTREHGEEAI